MSYGRLWQQRLLVLSQVASWSDTRAVQAGIASTPSCAQSCTACRHLPALAMHGGHWRSGHYDKA